MVMEVPRDNLHKSPSATLLDIVPHIVEGEMEHVPRKKLPRHGSQESTSSSRFQKFVLTFTGCLEGFFFKWGYTVASHPFRSIVASLLITLIGGMGFMNFTYEDRPDKLLIPQASQLAYDTDWLRANFPSPVRFSSVLLSADNILHPEVMMKLMDLQERVEKITVDGKSWEDVCFKLPITKSLSRRRRDIQDEDAFSDDFFSENDLTNTGEEDKSDPYRDPMISISDDLYCSIVDSLDQACYQVSPLELWGFNRSALAKATQEDIIYAINHHKVSPVFGRPINYSAELGGKIVRNEKGEIIQAESIIVLWSVALNKTELEAIDAVKDDGTGELADKTSLAWESKWIEVLGEFDKSLNASIAKIYYVTGRSFGDIYKNTMNNDLKIVIVGYIIMFFYVALMLGRFNMVEQRPYIAMAGTCCAGLGGILTIGVCSTLGLPFGNVNKVLPFLLLGIGVDDMFVIMQCWKNLYPNCLTEKYKEPLPVRVGNALRVSGASITVTSLTDMAAFLIGATTLLPGLKSFCIYAAVGVIAVFFFQITFFLGWFVIDQRRLESRRDAFFFCKKYRAQDFIPNAWSQTSYIQVFFEKVLAKYILTKPGKICVLVITGIFLAVNINGNLKLKQEFDPLWFLSQDSHLVQYMRMKKEFYPNNGFNGFIVGEKVNWTASFGKFEELIDTMHNSSAIAQFDTWYEDFKKYSNRNFNTDIPNTPISPKKFQKYLGRFLFSRIGAKYRLYFKANDEITCGERSSVIKISMMPFKFTNFNGRDEHIPGMHELKRIVKDANLTYYDSTGRLFSWNSVFVSWETDEIITDELYRNVALSLACVVITIFFLLFNVRMCIFAGLCVIFTVIDLCGVMYYWGMSIDTISLIANVVAIGLCVDYAAHIGLAFMTVTGTKESRATQALINIGPAVLNGGFSTFLGVVCVSYSETHALRSFFKILTSVVFFGLFHGLVFLPVLLSMFGPDPYPTALLLAKEHTPKSPKESNGIKPHMQELLPIDTEQTNLEAVKSNSTSNISYSQVPTN